MVVGCALPDISATYAVGATGGVGQQQAAGASGQSSSAGGVGGAANPSVTGFDKIDILLMIDNSLGMGEKQTILATAVSQMLRRLANPDCVDSTGAGAASVSPTEPTTACPAGSKREFAPVNDIHLGVVTSSLGDFGGDICPEPQNSFHPTAASNSPQNNAQNDHAWLLGALPRSGLGSPFLSWTVADAQNFGTAIGNKQIEFANFVNAATEIGCGNEMGLEAWYRFLVDPKPPLDVIAIDQQQNSRSAVDTNILAQRQAFLRPDSLLVVVMLSDENDCSMRDTGSYAWVAMSAGAGFRMWRGSSICATNPNDPCCYSCMLGSTTLGVSQACLDQDTTCRQAGTATGTAKLPAASDDVNVRCRQQKKRFGFDLLFPPSRYVNALIKTELCPDQTYGDLDCNCTEARAKGVACEPNLATKVRNPIFTNLNLATSPTGPLRVDAQGVYVAGVVGIPWQDLALDTATNAALEYKSASQLNWGLFAPMVNEDYSTAVLGDPLMVESFSPRSGMHPVTGQALATPNAARLANSINGHEWITSDKDVQFACIFNLESQQAAAGTNGARVCDLSQECGMDDESDRYKICARRFDGCACTLTATSATVTNSLDPTVSKSPLCQAADGSYGNKQYFAKAYPGLRQLQVLRGFYEATASENVVVGSICPKDLSYANRNTPGYGYNPVVASLVERLRLRLRAN